MKFSKVGVRSILVFLCLVKSARSTICSEKGVDAGTEITTDQAFVDKALEQANKYRADHGVEPLKINQEICNFSQYWVNEMAKNDKMEHSKEGVRDYCSENLFFGTRKAGYEGSFPVDKWYEQEWMYNYDDAKFVEGIGHFTALIWKTSTEMCISSAKSESGKTYVAAEYFPKGNIIGQFKTNVPQKLKGTSGGASKLKESIWISTCISSVVSVSALLLGYNYHLYVLTLLF